MIDELALSAYHRQFDAIITVATESNARLVREEPDQLFVDHANVFIKSYIVSACSVLEAFIQDLAYDYTRIMKQKVYETNVPHNVVQWCTLKEKAKELFFQPFEINIERKDISDIVSGNVGKTITVFRKIGVDLDSDKEFRSYKDEISSTIEKRNLIVHHNDDASDLSMLDVVRIVGSFKIYSSVVFRIVRESPHLNA